MSLTKHSLPMNFTIFMPVIAIDLYDTSHLAKGHGGRVMCCITDRLE